MPTFASLKRSLTLPLRKPRDHDDPGESSSSPDEISANPMEYSASTDARPSPRRYNTFLTKLPASPSNPNGGGIFNVNLNGLARSNTTKSTKTPEPAFVVPSYVAPDNLVPNGVVFGKPLKESLRYANVQISTADANGELYVWGYIPVVVAKCGLYLKENATEVPGTFRVNGSTKRMRLLQEAFETPPRYGKNLDWKQENYTTHDVASVFRRYLTQMPEPVIPYDLYHQVTSNLLRFAKAANNQEEGVAKFKALIRQMPRANQYLLLYVLDLLSVFARKSDVNLMTATNLAVIFRPGLISHPNHEMSPQEHALSQKVLEFLIAQQDWFMLDIPPPPSRRNTTQNAPASPTTQGHERRASADQRHAHAQPPQHVQQSSTTAVHHLSLDQQQHSQPQNVSLNVPPLSPFGPSSVASRPFSQKRPISRFGSSSGALNEVGSEVDDVMIIPGGVEEEEFSAGPGGGWSLVSKPEGDDFKDWVGSEKNRPKATRRRTMERSDLQNREDALDDSRINSGGPSSSTTPSHHSSGNGVKRSRTLPVSRRSDDSKRLATQTAAGELVQASTSAGSTIPKDKDKENHGSLGPSAKDPSRRGLLLKKGRRASHAVEKDRTL
ncbi:rho GTPase activator [Coprinopsis sp. MPI-PUGE-AT-0042]|nr:rho GTPase activator [Coprinopsis sp. MPI-PUGE-AT-0042]